MTSSRTRPAGLAIAAAVLTLSCAAMGGAAWAQMSGADANGDGVITREEQKAKGEANFKRMDRNGDGVIDATELSRVKKFLSLRSPKIAAALDRIDANHDGKITHEEFMAASMARFDRMDTNHDGKIDKAEMDAAKAMMGAE